MKFLVPIILDVDPFGLPPNLNEESIEALKRSVQTAIRNSLSSSQGHGFSHPLEQDVSITSEIVGECLPVQTDGPYKKFHEFDTEPTYISPNIDNEVKKKDVVLEAGIPWETRHALATLIIPVLNAANAETKVA